MSQSPFHSIMGSVKTSKTTIRRRFAGKTDPSKSRSRERRAVHPEDIGDLTTPWVLLGVAIIMIFLIGGLIWASMAQLDSAAIAHGVVAKESNRKTVAHLEGGIVRDILVEDGERVATGEPIILFDDTRAEATLALLQARLDAAMARQARLWAERDGLAEVPFPKPLLKRAADPEIARLLSGERRAFESHRQNIENQQAVIAERLEKARAETGGVESQLTAKREHRKLLWEELAMIRPLFDKGLVAKNRLLSVQQRLAETEGEIGDLNSRLAQTADKIAELRLQTALPRQKRLNEVTELAQETGERIAELHEKIRAAADILERTIVRAPVDGYVVDLDVHTRGGIVQPGQRLLDLVPEKDRAVIDLRIDPRDIDAVYAGMPAQIRLSAFNARTTPLLSGRVTSISADRTVDPQSGAAYFTGRVMPERDEAGSDGISLSAGMQAEVYLITSKRSVLDYLTEPVLRSFERAGREF
ncbi:MAG: HlyD family type I secretion periplasmic adaptor subunit [Rhodospirillales bacterium]|nr:HlyD family type I secretion periplasmic adaptor subunit [Rhodospirillales bacterium]